MKVSPMTENSNINVEKAIKLYKVLAVFVQNNADNKSNRTAMYPFPQHSNEITVKKIAAYNQIKNALNKLEEKELLIIEYKYLGDSIKKDDMVYNSLDIKRYKYYEIKRRAFIKIKKSLNID